MRLRELSFSEPLCLGLFLDQRKRIPFNVSRIDHQFIPLLWCKTGSKKRDLNLNWGNLSFYPGYKGVYLNPIENVWAEMVTSMGSRHVATHIILRENVTEIWRQLGRGIISKHFAILWITGFNLNLTKVNGDWTKY
jgi:hypothetical protein